MVGAISGRNRTVTSTAVARQDHPDPLRATSPVKVKSTPSDALGQRFRELHER